MNEPAGFLRRLAAAWPASKWRDVHVVVAVSGGADSMALLRGLLELKQRDGGAGAVHAVHVNHQLRREAADADETWVLAECKRLGVPLAVERANVTALAARQGDGLEAAARTARYAILIAAAERLGARFVALGHTQDDQVETVLFRVLRGTGLRGLAGMPAMRRLSASVSAVRPLLAFTREDVLRYLEETGQCYREDASNVENRFTRNRVRHELLPLLRDEYNHEVDAALVRLGSLAGEAQAVIDDLAEKLLERCRVSSNDKYTIALQTVPLMGVREILAADVMRRAWREAQFAEQGMTREKWRQLAQFAQAVDASTASGLTLPGNVQVSRPAAGVIALRAGGLS
jgi:tRNA(Ile)-lysidine synthase